MSTMNLLPEDYIAGRLQRRANIICLGLFVAVMGGVVIAVLVSDRSLRATETYGREVAREYEEAARLIEQLEELEREKRRLRDKAMATASLMERVPRSTLLAMFTNALPRHASLLKVDLRTQQAKGEAAKRAKRGKTKFAKAKAGRTVKTSLTVVKIVVTGIAPTDVEVAKFISELSANPLAGAVDLVYSQETDIKSKGAGDDVIMREFQVNVELAPEVDAVDVVDSDFETDGPAVIDAGETT